MGLDFRGVQFEMFCFPFFSICFSWKGQCLFVFICRFFALLYEEKWVSLVLQGSLEQVVWDNGGFLLCVSFCFPLLNLGSDCWTGVTDWKFGIPRDLGEGEIRKPAALQRKKKRWPWTVLIFPNHSWCGEKREATPPTPTFSSRGGFWKYNQQKTTNFLVYL